jgi:4-diphosphocytidyl-2-C-methyl-D-erythritol kinase
MALQPLLKVEKGVHIHLKKNIPHGAGLGGGSADAAAVLKGLNELWDLGLSVQHLLRIGVGLGADVPFCIFGGTAHARGIGERLRRIPDRESLPVLLINPGIHVSTKEVFEALDGDLAIRHPETQAAMAAWQAGDYKALRESAGNRLREVTVVWHPEIKEIEDRLMAHGAVFAMMSGSGPTVFGLFKEEEACDRAYQALKDSYPVAIRTMTGRRDDFHVED